MVARGGFHHRNGNFLKLCERLNDENHLFWFKLSYMNKHLHLVNNLYHWKPSYTDPCNFLTKRALMSRPCTAAVAKDSNILHYLNQFESIHFPTLLLCWAGGLKFVTTCTMFMHAILGAFVNHAILLSYVPYVNIRTLHDCPSQMNENLLISNSKLTSDSELIWWR